MSEKHLALVTGASSGIGKEIARLFAADGIDLVLVARTTRQLEMLADELRNTGVSVQVITADLCRPESPSSVIGQIEQGGRKVTHLVNCAGFGHKSAFWRMQRSTALDMIDLNIRAVTDLTSQVLPSMVEAGFGRVLNIASIAGFQAGPNLAVYCASKSFILTFSESIAHELRGTGVTVTAFAPGATQTNFAQSAVMSDSVMFKLGFAVSKPESVAIEAYRTMNRGRLVRIHRFANRILIAFLAVLPRALRIRLVSVLI